MTEEFTKAGIHETAEGGLETPAATAASDRYAIIAGNGRFPFLVLEAAHDRGVEPLVVAIKEEAFPELGKKAREIEWLSLGEVARLLELLAGRGINRVVLAGQVKHVQLFSSIKPDVVVERTLNGMERKNTDALIGVFVSMLEARGIEVVDSTLFLKPLLADSGVMTDRAPDEAELADVAYGREIAKTIAGLDIGQTIVVADRACVAIEAMEGTDATIERAAALSNGKRLVVVKVSKPQQDMRFDVPVAGVRTIRVMQRANARVLAVDSGRTLLFEREQLIGEANQAGIAVIGMDD
ncbi:MAG TPA: UDP-2,3-diacylglucosamine diphosphatase LpxI [Terriglobia bacterium]|nr:UDP-2,3-diacylglucosamine diphosphatase LpxI [Terriglobia bacterium]